MITKNFLKIYSVLTIQFIFGCSLDKESKGSVETFDSKGDTILVKLFYDNEKPKYTGRVYKNLKQGIHKEFSEIDSGKVVAKMSFSNDILDSIVYYNKEGIEIFYSKATDSKIISESSLDEVFVGDTLRLFLKFEESKYDFLSFIPGYFTNSLDFASGSNSIQSDGLRIKLNYPSKKVGKDTIRGYLIENSYKMFNDSMATHVGIHQYFEYPIEVKLRSEI
ncbi:MAG: hypothetical protein AAF620_18885 [Bacteroidota bacterium]